MTIGVSMTVVSSTVTKTITVSMAVSVVSVVSIGLSLGLGISGPLAKTLDRSGSVAGGKSGVSSDSKTVISNAVGSIRIAVSVAEMTVVSISLSLGIGGPLATTSETGGGCEGSGNSGPVRVGVVKGRVVVTVVSIGISLSLGVYSRDNSAENSKLVHVDYGFDFVVSAHCG